MLVIRIGIHEMLVRIANRADFDQTASFEAVWSGSALFVKAFSVAHNIENTSLFSQIMQSTVAQLVEH